MVVLVHTKKGSLVGSDIKRLGESYKMVEQNMLTR